MLEAEACSLGIIQCSRHVHRASSEVGLRETVLQEVVCQCDRIRDQRTKVLVPGRHAPECSAVEGILHYCTLTPLLPPLPLV